MTYYSGKYKKRGHWDRSKDIVWTFYFRSWIVFCLHFEIEFRSCTMRRQWCGILHSHGVFHNHWWTASFKPRLLFSSSESTNGRGPLIFCILKTLNFLTISLFTATWRKNRQHFQWFVTLPPPPVDKIPPPQVKFWILYWCRLRCLRNFPLFQINLTTRLINYAKVTYI